MAVDIQDVGKCYEIYPRPIDRLKQTLYRGRRRFYREFWALHHVTLQVRRGEAIGIIGRNGSGKSTLLQIVAGTLRPTEGMVTVGGRVHALLELGSGFNPEFTGRENVFLNGAVLGLTERQVAAHFDEIAAFADIGDFLNLPVKTYSTGMVVRLAFAVQALLEPEILIVDEALAVGDIMFQQRCIHRIRKLRERGTTLLFVSHDPDTVRALCERAVWLEQGRVRMLGPARDVAERYLESFCLQNNAEVLSREQAAPDTPEQFFTPLTAALEGLDGAELIVVDGVRLLNEAGQPTEQLSQGERFTVEAVIGARRDVDHISVGILIKDRLGIELTGESVFNRYRRGLTLRAGDRRTVRFSAVNNLQPGNYGIALRVNRVSRWDRSDDLLLYADDVARAFQVRYDPEHPMWFRFRHPFEVSIS